MESSRRVYSYEEVKEKLQKIKNSLWQDWEKYCKQLEEIGVNVKDQICILLSEDK